MSWNVVELNVIRWAEDRKIIPNSTSAAQVKKAFEELTELRDAIAARNRKEIIDGFGDVMVCLINAAALEDLDLTTCLKAAYEEIKDRKGTMNEQGIFVKQS